MITFVIWITYLAWVALFIWLGWKQLGRVLSVSGGLLIIAFAAFYAWSMEGAGEPGWHSGGSFAAGMMVDFAFFLLVAPVLVGAITFLSSKLWDRV